MPRARGCRQHPPLAEEVVLVAAERPAAALHVQHRRRRVAAIRDHLYETSRDGSRGAESFPERPRVAAVRTLPSSPPETTRSSSGAIARQLIGAEWPGNEVSIGWASETSHSRT